MKKTILLALTVMLIIALITGCTQSSSKSDKILIGVNYELSGETATYGQSSVEGIELAINKVNEAGGINGKLIELVKYDNESKSANATSLATRLMTQDKVLAVMGPATSGAFKATIPVANQNKVPVISGSATADDVTVNPDGSVQEYAFRICFSDSYQGTAMANYALNNLSKTKAVVIMDSSSDYGKGLAANFVNTFEANGGTIVAQEAYVSGDTDFNSILTKIRDLDFDVIFIPGYYNEAGLIIKQARDLGIDVPILGADGFDSPELVNLAGKDALNDIYFSNHYSSLDQDPVVQDFIKEFEKKYNKQPDAFNALGYDLAMFVVNGIERAESLTGEAVKKALESTTDFNGVTGSFSIDEFHNPVKAIVVIELKDGVQHSSERLSLD
ncbi:MAG: ABC transporter substrate-binding protein [Caldicoprobacterales bacterium]|jgi:branched-chain amino acid transport system substrate-binding protein